MSDLWATTEGGSTHLYSSRGLQFTEGSGSPFLGNFALSDKGNVEGMVSGSSMLLTSSTVVIPHSLFIQKPFSCQ